jgi:hypothetical protein
MMLAGDLQRAFNGTRVNGTWVQEPDFVFNFGLYYAFERPLPATARTARAQQYKTLDTTRLADCQTSKQLIELAQFIKATRARNGRSSSSSCPGESDDTQDKNKDGSASSGQQGKTHARTVRFAQAYNPDLILGSSDIVDVVTRKEHSKADQKHDILLTYECPDQWSVQASAEPTAFGSVHADGDDNGKQIENPWLTVDPETCEPIRKLNASSTAWEREAAYQAQVSMQRYDNEVIWTRVKFTLFSMMVSASFFASYNVTTFYTGVTVLVAQLLRPNLLFASFMGFLYETTKPDAAIKLVEACYMKRHEEDLIGEEETYRML